MEDEVTTSETTPEVVKKAKPLPLVALEQVSNVGRKPPLRAEREIKMVRPVCEKCQHGHAPPGWFNKCSHDPYFSNVREDVLTPVIMCSPCDVRLPDGAFSCQQCGGTDLIQTGTETKPAFRKQPNTRPVRISQATNAGQGFERAKRKGYKLPQEIGFAPMCEYGGCWAANPTFQSKFDGGWYCNEREAQNVAAGKQPEALEVVDEARREAFVRSMPV